MTNFGREHEPARLRCGGTPAGLAKASTSRYRGTMISLRGAVQTAPQAHRSQEHCSQARCSQARCSRALRSGRLRSQGFLLAVIAASVACSGARVRADGPPAAPCLLQSSTAQAATEEGASGQPAPGAHGGHSHHHSHHHSEPPDENTDSVAKDSADAASDAPAPLAAGSAKPVVIDHAQLTPHEHRGNALVGIATPSLGARDHEVWRSRVAVGSSTPLHTHGSEEIFVFLRGRGRARIGEETVEFVAPATVIAPAGLPHQFFNTGDEPTDAIVIVRPGSEITDAKGNHLDLPWRR